jgi:P27 family predicted phage terminase small subunit
MKGRKPKPNIIKIRQGNPGGRPLNDDEPEPEMPDECPEPPDHLNDIAKKEWKRIAPQLYNAGLLTYLDVPALSIYCNAYARWIEAEENIENDEKIKSTPKGYLMQNPHISIANKAIEQMKAFLIEFGMTPASRTRVKSERGKGKEKKKGFASL